jgi:hypothetical protein
MNKIRRAHIRAALLGLTLLAAGCTPGFGDISGKVTYKGKPVAGATIMFYDVANNSVPAIVDADGNYKVEKVAAGTAKIAILVPIPIVFASPTGKGGGTFSTDKPALTPPKIPAKYSNPEQSGLTYEVKKGPQTKDFALGD